LRILAVQRSASRKKIPPRHVSRSSFFDAGINIRGATIALRAVPSKHHFCR